MRWSPLTSYVSRALERFERRQYLAAVEQPDVLGLDRGEAADRPGEVHEVRLHRRPQRMHPGLFRQEVALAGVAGAARRQHVGPRVRPAARQRHQMIPRQALAVAQLRLATTAELAAVVVAGEQERVGDLEAEPARHVIEHVGTNKGGA